ncbi:MAG: hypothetical protein V4619_06345 [Bacteroidota bacterium]
MKTKLFIASVAAFCLIFSACSKKADTAPTPATKKKYLTKVIRVETSSPSSGSVVSNHIIDYTYDSNKRLSSSKSGTNISTYAYYDNGDLYTITNGSGANRIVYEFTYAEGKLKSYTLKSYQNNILVSSKLYEYVYDGDKVSEIHFEVYYVKYTYDSNGNVTRIFNYGSPQFTTVYEYDNKKNKIVDSRFKYPTVGDIAGDGYNPNNRTVRTTEGLNQNVKSTTIYTYDSDGYPTAGTESADYAASSTYKFTFVYSTLD